METWFNKGMNQKLVQIALAPDDKLCSLHDGDLPSRRGIAFFWRKSLQTLQCCQNFLLDSGVRKVSEVAAFFENR